MLITPSRNWGNDTYHRTQP